MKSLTTPLHEQRILSVTAHPDDLEMHHLGLLDAVGAAFAYVATRWRSQHRRLQSELTLLTLARAEGKNQLHHLVN